MRDIDRLMGLAPVIPVLVIDRVEDARPIAEALVAGGLPVLEVTLRTPAALDAIRAMKQVPGAIVGAGTVLDPGQLSAALEAGAEFIVSPGLTERLGMRSPASGVPYLPGISTTGDIMRALRPRLHAAQILPRRGRRRAADPQGAERRVRRRPLLPDRRHHPGQCAGPGSICRPSPASADHGWCRAAKPSTRPR